MKKSIKIAFLTILSLFVIFAFVGCAPDTSEVAGRYEMTSISGNVSGITVTKDSYSYFRMILDDKGNGTVQSKGAGIGASAYEAKGTFTYKDGIIRFTVSNGYASATEEYEYADGVITYSIANNNMNFTVVLTRVVEEVEE